LADRRTPKVKQHENFFQALLPRLRLFCWNIWLGADLDDGNPGIGQIAVGISALSANPMPTPHQVS
jgi:hypothetical protein